MEQPSSSTSSQSSQSMALQVRELDTNTDLNVAPADWLKGQFSRDVMPWLATKVVDRSRRRILESDKYRAGSAVAPHVDSLVLASSHIDRVGVVDVISSGDTAKRLLKLPYNNDRLSVTLHRVGNTVLIDNFDGVGARRMAADMVDEKALQQLVLQQLATVRLPRAIAAPPTRSELTERQLVSKFLYHSIENASQMATKPATVNDNTSNDVVIDPIEHGAATEPLVADTETPSRDVEWTFEDIRMLVNTDVPIFGCGKHPCVSLKLRDMRRPISVLTGIDYWLDGLMCNVPEVLMCCHLDGIVQKYDLIKTDDLPHLSECKFDKELIYDVASNLLSFIRDNATKEGHTYWLFKAPDDDVVKLYDLTSLCSGVADQDMNPFIVPVAVLMYRVARNLLHTIAQRARSHSNYSTLLKRIANSAYRLLNNCLELLTVQKYPQLVSAAYCSLANVYMLLACDAVAHTQSGSSRALSVERPPPIADRLLMGLLDDQWQPSKVGSIVSSVSMHALGNKAHQSQSETSTGAKFSNLPSSTDSDESCKRLIDYVYEGLQCCFTQNSTNTNTLDLDEELPRTADPSQAIPLHDVNLASTRCRALIPYAVRRPHASQWQREIGALLLLRAAVGYRLLAERALQLSHFGRALRYSRHSVTCLSAVIALPMDDWAEKSTIIEACAKYANRVLLPSCIVRAADSYVRMTESTLSDSSAFARHAYDLRQGDIYRDTRVLTVARDLIQAHQQRLPCTQFEWLLDDLSTNVRSALTSALHAYDAVLLMLSTKDDKKGSAKRQSPEANAAASNAATDLLGVDAATQHCPIEQFKLSLADVHSRRGAVHMNWQKYYIHQLETHLLECGDDSQSVSSSDAEDEDTTNKPSTSKSTVDTGRERYIKKAYRFADKALEHVRPGTECFRFAADATRSAFLYANAARVHRLLAHAHADHDAEMSEEEERHLLKAIDNYTRADECLAAGEVDVIERAKIALDTATVHSHYARLLQDRPPHRRRTIPDIERGICDELRKSIDLYESLIRLEVTGTKASERERLRNTALNRTFECHYRLASMYHQLARTQRTAASIASMPSTGARQRAHLAEVHYARALAMYVQHMSHMRSAQSCNDALRTVLERLALHETAIGDLPPLTNATVRQHMRRVGDALYLALIEAAPVIEHIASLPGTMKQIEMDCNALPYALQLYVSRVQHLLKTQLHNCKSLTEQDKEKSRNEARLAALKAAYAVALRIPTAVEKLSPQEIYSSIITAANTLQRAKVLERSDDYVIVSI